MNPLARQRDDNVVLAQGGEHLAQDGNGVIELLPEYLTVRFPPASAGIAEAPGYCF